MELSGNLIDEVNITAIEDTLKENQQRRVTMDYRVELVVVRYTIYHSELNIVYQTLIFTVITF